MNSSYFQLWTESVHSSSALCQFTVNAGNLHVHIASTHTRVNVNCEFYGKESHDVSTTPSQFNNLQIILF